MEKEFWELKCKGIMELPLSILKEEALSDPKSAGKIIFALLWGSTDDEGQYGRPHIRQKMETKKNKLKELLAVVKHVAPPKIDFQTEPIPTWLTAGDIGEKASEENCTLFGLALLCHDTDCFDLCIANEALHPNDKQLKKLKECGERRYPDSSSFQSKIQKFLSHRQSETLKMKMGCSSECKRGTPAI